MTPDDFKSFREDVLGLRRGKNFKITNSYGTKEGWRWLKKNKWLKLKQPVTEWQFGQIIKGINKIFINNFLDGSDIKFPHRMGKLELRKYKPTIKFEDNKLFTNLSIDWLETLKLWHKDKEAMENKILIRREADTLFKIIYNKHRAVYDNKHYYQFSPARDFKKQVKDRAINNKLDAFLL